MSGFVHVIESPSATDLLEGLTEGRALCEALKLIRFKHCYNLVTTRETLLFSLRAKLADAILKFPDDPPVLHLSMHGNQDGIGLTNGEFVSWHDLREMLQPINNAMSGQLLICLSACFGAFGIRMAQTEGAEHPFGLLVGHYGSAGWADAGVGYITFYHQMAKLEPIEACVTAMRIASGDDKFCLYEGNLLKSAYVELVAKTQNERLLALLRQYPAD